MSYARDAVYSFVNKLGDKMARLGPDVPWGKTVEPGSDDDMQLHDLLNRVEEDRAHAEAEKLRREGDGWGSDSSARKVFYFCASMIDPYEMRDGQLVRKSDGKPVNL